MGAARLRSAPLGSARFVFIPPSTGAERDDNRIPRRLGALASDRLDREDREPERTGSTDRQAERTGPGAPTGSRSGPGGAPGHRRYFAEVSERRGPGEIPSGSSQRSRVEVPSWRLQLQRGDRLGDMYQVQVRVTCFHCEEWMDGGSGSVSLRLPVNGLVSKMN